MRLLSERGIQTLRVERGGEVTYHGPGQLVAYPIVRLADAGLLLRPFVRALELAMADTARSYGIPAERREGYPGCWVDRLGMDGPPRKLGALGLRVEKGVTYHGIALNVTTDLTDFELIEPCGLTGITVTSIARELGWTDECGQPSTASVAAASERFAAALGMRLDEAVVASAAPRPVLDPGLSPALSRAWTNPMAGGLFELRRDDITGWWVAVVVDRGYDRSRFARAAQRAVPEGGHCQNCDRAETDGVWLRMLKPQAFMVAGGDREQVHGDTEREPGLGLLGDVGSWATIAAPQGHHGRFESERRDVVIEMLGLARDAVAEARSTPGIEYVQVVQNVGLQAGARTDHLCIDLYELPQIPHRLGEELGGAARYMIKEHVCPWCRLVRDEVATRDRLVYADASTVCFAPYASRSPFELWVVPRHHEADFGRATDAQIEGAADALQGVLRKLDVLDGPPYNLVLHTAPSKQRVDGTYHWHWEIHPRLREIAGLELGTGLPVNPVSPEDAVAELLGEPGRATSAASAADGPRSWDAFPRG